MKSYQKDIINDDGTEETILISSNDDYTLNMFKNYSIANHKVKKKVNSRENLKVLFYQY